ncbi:hypothetical protein TUBRATIS_17840 [Tubulinosema ratisbonensis]|uniref:Uncharacterized protein n=1 Tax=Tubulinosema ratisbonensis TaxID=291195 RepID=A0A437AKN1_9MICR|nr:hypothetical protein TUBRATIS_17840 [Tubulinosema ratisbonensis]
MNFVKILLSILGLFCVFITIGGYNLRNQSLINNTSNDEILDNSHIMNDKDLEQEISVFDDKILKKSNVILANTEIPPLVINEHLHNDSSTKEVKEDQKKELKEDKDFTKEEVEYIFYHIFDTEKNNVTNNEIFIGRVLIATSKILRPLRKFEEIKQKLRKYDNDLSKEIYKKINNLRNEYFESVNSFLEILFFVKNNQIELSKLFLEKKGIKFILSEKNKNEKEMKKKFKEKFTAIRQTYVIFTKNISSLLRESILVINKIFSIYKELLSNINLRDLKDEIEPLIHDFIFDGITSKNSLITILKNVYFKLTVGFELMKNYYELCKEKHKENEFSDELFNLCEKDYNFVSELIDNFYSEWEKTALTNNKILDEEIFFLQGKGLNIN